MSMEQNQLTRDLYAAGYTREDHPSFVYWSDWQNFGYLFEVYMGNTVRSSGRGGKLSRAWPCLQRRLVPRHRLLPGK